MQSIWAFHVFPSRSSSSLQTPEKDLDRREGTRDAFQRKHLQGEVKTDKPIQKLVPQVIWQALSAGEDERHAVRIVLLRGEFFQEIRNSLTIEVTRTGKLMFALRRFQVGSDPWRILNASEKQLLTGLKGLTSHNLH